MSDDYGSLVDSFLSDAGQAGAAGVFQDQKKIARSYELGRVTGVHPAAINGDLEGFEQRLQAKLAREIIEGSPELAAWINGDPMRAGLASGDLANLDNGLSKLGAYTAEVGKRVAIGLTEHGATTLRGYGAIGLGLREDPKSILEAFAEEIPAISPIGSAVLAAKRFAFGGPKLKVSGDVKEEPLYKAGEATSEFVKHLLGPTDILNPVVRDLAQGVGSFGATAGLSLIPGVGRFLAGASALGGGMGEAAERAVKAGATPEQVVRATSLGTYAGATDFADIALVQFGGKTGQAMAFLGKVGMRALMGAFIEGGQEGLQQFIQNSIAKGIYKPDQDLMEDVPYNAFLGMVIGSGARVGLGTAQDWQARRELKAADHFVKAGEEPPVGLSDTFDALKERKLRADLKALEETQRAFDQSELKAVAPDQLVELIKNKVGDAENAFVRVSSEAVAKLYGTTEPTLDDGLLGFTPALVEQLKIASVAGGDILVPLADWLGRVDSAVYRELKEDIRTQEAGFTLREVEALKERQKGFREVSEMAELPSKLKLTKLKTSLFEDETRQLDQGIGHSFVIENEKGEHVGELTITELKEGKHLHVDWIGAAKHVTSGIMGGQRTDWVLGPHLMLQLAKQVREMFPEAEEVSGYRVSGAREKDPKLITRKFDLRSDDAMYDFVNDLTAPRFIEELRRVYGLNTPIGWSVIEAEESRKDTTYFEHGPLKITTTEAFTPEELANIDKATEILNRIVPRYIEHTPVLKIDRTLEGVDRSSRGVYINYEDRIPWLLYTAIDTADVTVRHEAIHHLKRMGFFTEQEWSRLYNTALAEGWIDKERVGSTSSVRDRYKHLDPPQQIEEAIADEFGYWLREGKGVSPEVTTIFERLKKFFEELKAAFREAFGEQTAADIFKKIESGEIGRRDPVGSKQGFDPTKATFAPPIAEMSEVGDSRKVRRLADEKPAKTTEQVEAYESLKNAKGRENEAELIQQRIRQIGYDKRLSGQEELPPYYKGELVALRRRLRELSVRETSHMVEPPRVEEPKAPEGVERSVWEQALKTMTKADYERYMKLMERRNREDYEWELEKAQREEKRRQTEEWKYQEKLARDQAKNEVEASSGITLLRMLRDGVYQGEKMPRLWLDEAALTKEQKEALPKDYVRPRGTSPADLAQLFGYPDGETMIDDLVRLEKKRGVGRFENFIQREIEQRTDELMKEAFGDLEANILQEAKDRVTGVTEADILWEDMIRMAVITKTEMPFDRNDLANWAETEYASLPIQLAKMDRFLKEVGRAYKAMETAFLKNEVGEAFKQSQRRVYNFALAQEAKRFEKRVTRFDKLAHRFRKREVKGVNQQYTNFIHQLLVKAGYPVQRSVQDIETEIVRGDDKTFPEFVATSLIQGWELQVSDTVLTGNIKPLEQMTVEDFREFSDSITSLASIGRKVERLLIGGKDMDYADWKEGALANMKELPFRAREKQKKILYEWDAELARTEEIVKDLDLRRELGPMFRGLIEPMMEAKHKSYQLQEALTKRLEAIRKGFGRQWQSRLGDDIEQDFFYDPYYDEGPDGPQLFKLTRNDLLRIAMNFGNRSSINKFTEGYVGREQAQLLEAQLRNLMNSKLSKEDWEYVQHMIDIFGSWQADIEAMYYNLSGIAPKMIEAEPFVTPHGIFRGGYFPLMRDHSTSTPIKGEDNVDSLFGGNYFRATTANFYTRERTGARYKVDFLGPIEIVASRMQQVMHDLAYRPAVMQANKILNDASIMDAIKKHYGEEYAKQLKPWLKDIAQHYDQDEKKLSKAVKFARRMRMGLMVHALGFNLNVFFSPSVGMLNPKSAAAAHVRWAWDFDGAKALAMEHSKEIPHTYRNLDRDFRERLEKIIITNRWDSFTATAARWAFTPIAWYDQQFRINTFAVKFKLAVKEGRTEEEAATIADAYVRQHHGATGLPDLPAIMRGGEFSKVATVFYGYFNSMYNWLRQLPNQARANEWKGAMKTIYGAFLIPAMFGALLFNQGKEDDSWFKTVAKALGLQLLSYFPFARELGTMAIEGHPSRTPWGSVFSSVESVATDIKKVAQGKRAEKPIKHTAAVVGMLTPLPLGQFGKTGQFLYDVARGPGNKQPRDIFEWWRGIRTGEARLKRSGQR